MIRRRCNAMMLCTSLLFATARSAAAFGGATARTRATSSLLTGTGCRAAPCPAGALVLHFSSSSSDNCEVDPFPRNLYLAWSLDDDRLLWQNRDKPTPKLASMLGRGLRGIEARLDKLQDRDSPAYERLFAGGKIEAGDGDAKGGKLTPAVEVLRRIRWDGTLNPSDFTVLYYDRVDEKIEEAKFDAPNESVKGKEEFFVFAIPEHRISAVKYKERIVWDKDQRLDTVFGSMRGDGVTIDAVIDSYAGWKEEREEEMAANRARQAEVAARIKSTLGDQRYAALKDLSSQLQYPTGSLMATDASIEEYVRGAINLFRVSRDEKEGIEGEDAGTRRIRDLEALDMLSELVALLPDDVLRERILLNIESNVDRLEGRKQRTGNKKEAQNQLPELNEDDLEETFVRGSGAGGQKINKTSNRVILVHLPTNCRVECQDTRSLQQNRKIARKRLRLKVDEFVNGASSRANIKAVKAVSKKNKSKARNRARQRKKKEAAEAEAEAAASGTE